MALRRLPFGVPKMVVSTVASGNLRPYFGHEDVAVFFSVADLLGGPNLVSRPILEAATAAIAGMVAAIRRPTPGAPCPWWPTALFPIVINTVEAPKDAIAIMTKLYGDSLGPEIIEGQVIDKKLPLPEYFTNDFVQA